MAKQPETLFKERVKRDLETLDRIWFYKTQEVSRRGIPDFIICLRGLFYAFELKVDSPVEPLQQYTLNKIQKADGTALVVTPQNWEQIFNTLKGVKNVRK